jgi:hypothetical protein
MKTTTLPVYLVLLLFSLACHKADTSQKVLFESGFEGNSSTFLTNWDDDQRCCDYSMQSSPLAREGKNSLRLEVRKTDPIVSSSIRSEVTMPTDYDYGERWYGFSIYLENWDDDPAGEHIFQWHPNSSSGSAVLSLFTNEDKFTLVHQNGGTASSQDFARPVLGPLLKNQWVDFVLHVIWASKDTGLIEIWINGVKKYTYNGQTDWGGQYIKLGVNKFCWVDQCVPSTVDTRVLYIDAFRVGNEKANYSDVKPGH